MKFTPTRCPLCGSGENFTVVLEQNFKPSDLNVKVFSARRLPDRLHYRLVKCDHDGMIRSNPIADTPALSSLYQRSQFTYDGEVGNLTRTYISALQPALRQIDRRSPILEIGCGNGFILEELSRMGFQNVRGVEPSDQAVAKANAKIRRRIVHSMFSKDRFRGEKFDLIYLFQTLDHVPNPDIFLRDCLGLLNPGGFLLSFHHNVESWSAKVLGEKSPIFDIEHTQLFSMVTSRKIFEKVGLRVVRVNSPTSILSWKHLLWLFPLPREGKKRLLQSQSKLVNLLSAHSLPLKLGNTCIIGQKEP
jgi:SAM-dependent methyltransferase